MFSDCESLTTLLSISVELPIYSQPSILRLFTAESFKTQPKNYRWTETGESNSYLQTTQHERSTLSFTLAFQQTRTHVHNNE